MNWADEKSLKTNLTLIVHHADHMASRIEYEMWKSNKSSVPKKTNSFSKAKPKVSTANKSATDLFKDVFGD